MNCKPCSEELGIPVVMKRVEHKNREVIGARKRDGVGYFQKRKTVSIFFHWYCPNSFAHTIVEE